MPHSTAADANYQVPLIRPPALASGDIVAVVSPSAGKLGQYVERADRGLRNLERLGLRTVVMPHARKTGRWVSAPIEERVADLHEAFADPRIRGIVSAIGGRGSAQLLPYLDYDLIAANPKIFCGYSDSTALHTAIRRRTGLVTFYGPSVLMEFAEFPDILPETARGFVDAVTRPAPLGLISPFDTIIFESSDWDTAIGRRRAPCPSPRVLRAGSGSGPLAGGCLPVLCELLGTPWAPDLHGAVVLLDTPQKPYDAGQAMTHLGQLANAGLLDSAAAIVIGWPWSADLDDDLAELVGTLVSGDFPILFGMPFGHTSPMVTMPLGVRASLDGARFWVEDPAVAGAEVPDLATSYPRPT
jgi:muramoyltetrapeptide carboxypeptidase LdcA involved in peptidoglycan recycling